MRGAGSAYPARKNLDGFTAPNRNGFCLWRNPGQQKMSNRQAYLALPILNIFVPHVGQTPWVAGLPFFIVISLGSFISRLALHLTQ
jgi:hypothetical protein